MVLKSFHHFRFVSLEKKHQSQHIPPTHHLCIGICSLPDQILHNPQNVRRWTKSPVLGNHRRNWCGLTRKNTFPKCWCVFGVIVNRLFLRLYLCWQRGVLEDQMIQWLFLDYLNVISEVGKPWTKLTHQGTISYIPASSKCPFDSPGVHVFKPFSKVTNKWVRKMRKNEKNDLKSPMWIFVGRQPAPWMFTPSLKGSKKSLYNNGWWRLRIVVDMVELMTDI